MKKKNAVPFDAQAVALNAYERTSNCKCIITN